MALRFFLCCCVTCACVLVLQQYYEMPRIPGLGHEAQMVLPVTAIMVVAFAMSCFVEAAVISRRAAQAAADRAAADRRQYALFQLVTVPTVSDGQTQAAARDHAWRVGRVNAANNGAPLPNRDQVGSSTYGA